MTKTVAALTLVLLLLAAHAFAWNEPDSFYGIPWGATHKQVVTALKSKGGGDRPEKDLCLDKTHCWGYFPLGSLKPFMQFRLRNDRLVFGTVEVDAASYPALRAMFVERYGPPTATERPDFQTKGGVRTSNEILRWEGPKVAIELKLYASTIQRSFGSVVLREELERQDAAAKKAIKKGKDDL